MAKAKAKAQPQVRALGDIQKDIAAKEAEREKVLGVVGRLDGELDALKQEALEPIRALAKEMGFQVVKVGEKPGTKPTGKATTKPDTEAWLKEQLGDGPKTEEELRAAYGEGRRLRLKSYVEKGLLKQGKDGAYTLA